MAEGPNGIGTISRRRVLTGVAWATPAIVLAVATPPAAASETGETGVVTVTGDHVILTGFSGGVGWHNSGNNGWGGQGSYYYQFYIAGDVWPNDQVVATAWVVEIVRTSDDVVVASQGGTAALAGSGGGNSTNFQAVLTGLPSGTYRARLRVSASPIVTPTGNYQPNPISSTTAAFTIS